MSIQANKIQTHRFEYATPGNPADFDPADLVEKAISWVKSLVKPGEKIALSASGGVDSTIAPDIIDANAECFKMDSRTTVVPEEGTRPEIPF